jgi:hypothetical protein
VIRLLDDYRTARDDSGEIDEGKAGRSFDFTFAHLSRRGCWFDSVASLMPSSDGCDDTFGPTLGSVLSYLMHGCTKGLCGNLTDLFFQNPSLHSIQSLSFFLTIFGLALILIILLTQADILIDRNTNTIMSNRQTRNTYRSRLNTPVPSKIVKREKDGSDEASSTSADESGGEAWNSKNDGTFIKQAHYGGKRTRRGRGRGLKKGTVGTDKRRRKRVKSESIDVEPKEDIEDKATQQEEEEVNATTIEVEVEDQGNQAELEEEVPQQEPEPTARRSGRATKTPERFDEVRFQPYGAPVQPINQVNITKALRKLKESRAPSRPRGISPDGSPDPIASFSDDHDHDVEIDPVEQGPIDEVPISNPLPISTHEPLPVSTHEPPKSKMVRPRKSALKPKTPSGPRKKGGKVTIDESRNQTRTIKIISSTSSDIGRHPSLPIVRGRGPKRYGVRSRRTVPVMGISPYTGKRAVQRYEYVVSSDSTESEDEDMIDPAEFREWIEMKREQEKRNGAFLLTLAARISDSPTTSSTLFPVPPPPTPIPSTTLPPTLSSSLPPQPEAPVWTKPFSLTPIRPPPPINPNHPPHQEQEKVSFP